MRIDRPESLGPAWDRLRAVWSRMRRQYVELGAGMRLAAIAGLLVSLAVVGFLAAPGDQAASSWLYPEHRFAPDDARRLVDRLSARGIAARVVGGRVEVPTGRLTEAYAEIEKAGLSPQSIWDLADAPTEAGFFATASERAHYDQRREEKRIELMIQQVDPSLDLSAFVTIHRSMPRGLARTGSVEVSVFLKVAGDRTIPAATVERIRNVVRGQVFDLSPDGLTLMDNRGTPYAIAGDPAVGLRSQLDARRDDMHARLVDGLNWIPGVRVAVKIEPGSLATVTPDRAAELEPIVADFPPVITVNAPVEAVPGHESRPTEPVEPVEPARAVGKVSVLVLVPSSFYTTFVAERVADHEPTTDDYRAIARKTEESIRQLVEQVVPEDERGTIAIDRIFAPTLARPEAPIADPGGTRRLPDWWPAAAGGGLILAAAALMAAGSRLRAAVQPPRHAGRGRLRRPHFDVDVAEDAGPSERVRELIRRDPAAASGVLRRWIGEGGYET